MSSYRVLDTTTGEIKAVSAGSHLEEGLRSGRYQLSNETTSIALRDAEGNAYDVGREDLAGALSDPRFHLETFEDRDRARARAEADENPIQSALIAGGANLARELTLGGSDVAVRRALETSDQIAVEEHREASPVAGAIGSVTGVLAPALLSGGSSLGARGGVRGLAALTPAGATAMAGTAVERAIVRQFGSTAGTRALATVSGAVADGALSGAAHAAMRANITGTPLEAEQVMSDALFGAVLGLGGGAVLAGGTEAVRGVASAVRRGAQGAAPTADRIAHYAERLVSRGLGEADAPIRQASAGVVDRAGSWASRVAPDDLALVRANPRRAFDAAGFERAASETAEAIGGLRRTLDDAGAALESAATRRAALEQAAAGANAATARASTRTALEASRARILEAVETIGDRRSAGSKALQGVSDDVQRAIARVDGAESTAGTAIGELDAVLASIDAAARRTDDAVAGSVLAELRAQVASVASDPGVFGAAGSRFSAIDGARNRLRGLGNGLNVDKKALSEGGEAASAAHQALRDAEEALGTVGSLGGDVTAAREALAAARTRLAETTAWARVRQAAERGLATEAAQSRAGRWVLGQGAKRLGRAAAARLTGLGAAGPVGAIAAGSIWRMASRPVSTYRRLDALGRSIRDYPRRLEAGLDRLRRSLDSGFLRDIGRAGVRANSRVVLALRGSLEERRAEYSRVTADLRELAADPDRLAERLEQTIGPVGEASAQLADAMGIAAVRGVAHLAEHLPASDALPTLMSSVPEPSQWEIDRFLRRYEAVEDPLSILDRAAEGSLRLEHRQAVEAVYPEVYAEIQAGVAELLASAEQRPSYQARLQLGTLMGVPADRSLQPDMLSALQSSYAQTTQQDAIIHGDRSAPMRVDDTFSSGAQSRTDEISSRL